MFRFFVTAAGLLTLTALPFACYSAEKSSVKDRLIALHDRIEAIEQGKETVALTAADRERIPARLTSHDQMVCKAVAEFGQGLKDEELDAAADFAASKDGAGVRWPLASVLIDLGQSDKAARVISVALVAEPKNREYRLWKWWEWGYSDRKNYKALTLSLTDALLRRFDAGDAETKFAIAEAFGKGAREAKLSLAEFKNAIEYDRKVGKK